MNTEILPSHQWTDFNVRKWDPYAHAKYEILLSWLGDIKGKSAYIVGVGSGEFAAYLALKGAQVTVSDIDEKILKIASSTAASMNVHFEMGVARIEDLPRGKLYDIVVALDVLEHVLDDQVGMSNLRAITKPNGTVLLTVPALPFVYGSHDESPGHFRRYTKKSILKIAAQDSKAVKIRYFGFCLIPVALCLSRWLRVPYPTEATGKASKSPGVLGRLIDVYFKFEKYIHPPLGVSLLLKVKNSSTR